MGKWGNLTPSVMKQGLRRFGSDPLRDCDALVKRQGGTTRKNSERFEKRGKPRKMLKKMMRL